MSENNSNSTVSAKQWKRVPFDIELAKKIVSGEVEGRIVSDIGTLVRILCFDRDDEYQIVGMQDSKDIFFYTRDGYSYNDEDVIPHKLYIKLQEETPKHKFKPFDKVLVRYPDKTELCVSNSMWIPGIFQYKSVNSNLYFVSGKAYKECIPYEGNEHLVGTTVNPIPKEG